MSEITITAPMIITPRLLPGVKIGDGMLSVEISGVDVDGKLIVEYAIDFTGESPARRLEYVGNDVRLGVIAEETDADLYRKAVSCLLSFLSADGEAYTGTMRDGTDRPADGWLFNAAVAEWAYMNDSEISGLKLEIEGDEWED